MKTRRTWQGFSTKVGHLRNVSAIIGVLTFSRRLAPVAVRPRSGFGMTRRTPCKGLAAWLLLPVWFAFLTAVPAWAGPPIPPAGAPDIFDPEVREHFQEVGMGNFRGNPDFPVISLLNTAGEQPQALLSGVDARKGEDTWSLTTDPIIQPCATQLIELAKMDDSGKLRPVFETLLTKSEARRAQEFSQLDHTRGKIALRVA